MGCGNSSPSSQATDGSIGPKRKAKPKAKSSPVKSMPPTPKITIDFVDDPPPEAEEEEDEYLVLEEENGNLNNANDEIANKNSEAKDTSTQVEDRSADNISNQFIGPKPTPETEQHSGTKESTNDTDVRSVPTQSTEISAGKDDGYHDLDGILAAQRKFNMALRFASLRVKPDSIMKFANQHIRILKLSQSLPPTMKIIQLMKALPFLQELDVSDNLMGPQAFRTLMLAMAYNTTVTSLNVSNNHTDTDSALSIGKMLTSNTSLISLNVSGNYLGKDYFSRCVGPAFASNKTLRILSCEGIGSVDFSCLLENASRSNVLTHLSLSHNTLPKTGPSVDHLISWIKKPDCSLHTLGLKTFGMKDADMVMLSSALTSNHSLCLLDATSNEIATTEDMFDFLYNCFRCQQLETLSLENTKIKVQGGITKDVKLDAACSLHTLGLSGCGISDVLIKALVASLPHQGLSNVEELNLCNNDKLSTSSLSEIIQKTKDAEGKSKLQRLYYGMNQGADLARVLTEAGLHHLSYLNLRKSKISLSALGNLAPLTTVGCLETLVLDGIKLAGSDALRHLLGNKDCSIIALSLANCLLADADLEQLTEALKGGLQLHMLKLTANRIQDGGIQSLVEALLSHPTHPLKLVDFQNNQITHKGASTLSDLFTSTSHKTQIHSINISNNNISGKGLESLVSVLGEWKLTNLVASRQKASYGVEDMDNIYHRLAETLGFTSDPEAPPCELPDMPSGLTVKMTGLGGFAGDLGRLLDCPAIVTDHQAEHKRNLTLSNILELSSALKGQDSADCLVTKEEWNNIIGVEKEAPSWLQLVDHRERALYLSHLPAAVTPNKLDGLFDMEADCNVDEVVLMKDEMTRKNNGFAWILLSDKKFVQTAEEFYNTGEAKVFSQPFFLSRINVKVDDDGSQQAEKAAREEMARRAAERSSDEAAHRRLIQQSYAESQARHAYRLANPAYADGRIW